jgi:hypothetical protein
MSSLVPLVPASSSPIEPSNAICVVVCTVSFDQSTATTPDPRKGVVQGYQRNIAGDGEQTSPTRSAPRADAHEAQTVERRDQQDSRMQQCTCFRMRCALPTVQPLCSVLVRFPSCRLAHAAAAVRSWAEGLSDGRPREDGRASSRNPRSHTHSSPSSLCFPLRCLPLCLPVARQTGACRCSNLDFAGSSPLWAAQRRREREEDGEGGEEGVQCTRGLPLARCAANSFASPLLGHTEGN